MRRAWSCFANSAAAPMGAALLVAAVGTPVASSATTVLERHIHVTLRADGTVRERSRLKVRLDNEDDTASWSTHQIALYDNRTLERLDARVSLPGGRGYALAAEDQETVDGGAGGFFHTSLRLHRARFRDLAPGAVLTLDQEVTVRPYYPAGRILLRGGGPVEYLEVVVDAEGDLPEGWRWSVEGPVEGLAFVDGDAGVRVHGRDLSPIAAPELSPTAGAARPVLRYGWGTDGTWSDVARWYHQLAVSVPRSTEILRAESRQLTSGLVEPRQRLDILVEMLQNKVRNVAVLIGDGNYRPSPPEEVLARKWGDCKDKAMVLIDLLREADIEAYPVLLLKNGRGRIDPRFPSPDQFNHAIVAVPSHAVSVSESDPVASGYLFIDTTQTLAAGRWLDPDAQDQDVLIVRPDGSEMVRTPLRPDLEHRRLTVDLDVTPEGSGQGRARLEIRGEIAYDLISRIGGLQSGALAEEARSLLVSLLPGAIASDLSWSMSQEGIPTFKVEAALELSSLVQGGEGSRSLLLPGMRATPDPQWFRQRRTAMVLPARSARTTWNLTLPESWCSAAASDAEVESEVGWFRQVVGGSGRRLTLDRQVEMRRRWVEAEELALLRELALAEHRAHRRRTRLRCDGG